MWICCTRANDGMMIGMTHEIAFAHNAPNRAAYCPIGVPSERADLKGCGAR